MDRTMAFQIFQNFQQELGGIFAVGRTCDTKMCVYLPKREGDQLVGAGAECFMMFAPEWHKLEDVPDVLRKNFYNLHVNPIPGTRKYTANMAAFPERKMVLSLKARPKLATTTPGTSAMVANIKANGTVTATTSFFLPGAVEVKDVRLIFMEQDLKFEEGEVLPQFEKVRLFGVAPQTSVEYVSFELFQKHCTRVSPDQVIIEETVLVTDAMRERFDAKSLAGQWLLAKAQSGVQKFLN